MVGYLGHDQELFHGSVEENIRLGGKEGAEEMIQLFNTYIRLFLSERLNTQ